ncbi:hypothetical protein GCM10007209_06950 [Haloferax sulfurifontis]|uniref:Uncharacterized protein n=1 Tax=Haloferax sulfurifontis TaxID=255616 RepID=A0A830E2M6_9EURY|nr:hypothetical protein GCM10007209_06950 [Haloferax sulfurifontis]
MADADEDDEHRKHHEKRVAERAAADEDAVVRERFVDEVWQLRADERGGQRPPGRKRASTADSEERNREISEGEVADWEHYRGGRCRGYSTVG